MLDAGNALNKVLGVSFGETFRDGAVQGNFTPADANLNVGGVDMTVIGKTVVDFRGPLRVKHDVKGTL